MKGADVRVPLSTTPPRIKSVEVFQLVCLVEAKGLAQLTGVLVNEQVRVTGQPEGGENRKAIVVIALEVKRIVFKEHEGSPIREQGRLRFDDHAVEPVGVDLDQELPPRERGRARNELGQSMKRDRVGIGLAYVPAAAAAPGTPIEVDVRGRPRAAEVRERPLYKSGEGSG